MSLYKLNFSIADKIIDRYAHLLQDLPNQYLYDKYGYSDMGGYDVIDISNSLALMAAYRVSTTGRIDEKKLEDYKRMANEDGVAILQYFSHFIPDNEKYELNQLDKSSPDFLLNSIRIQSDFQESDLWKKSLSIETPESFLKFCIQVKENEPDRYWHIVFSRLKVECDTSEKYDRIYYEFKAEEEKTLQKNNKPVESSSEITKEEKPVLENKKVENPVNRYKTDLLNLLFVGLFILCLFNLLIRNIFFSLLLCFNMFLIIFSWKQKLYTTRFMKFKLTMNIVMVVVLLIGLLNPTMGLYATIFCLSLQTFDLIRHFVITHLLKQIA